MSKRSEAVKRWRDATKAKLIAGLGGCCVCCGYNKCAAALELHHLDPATKEFSFSTCIARPQAWSRIVIEAAKCVLLCAVCHRELHAGVRQLPGILPAFCMPPSAIPASHNLTPCPVCLALKPEANKYCSQHCAGVAHRRVDWTAYDLSALLATGMSYVAISDLVGVSDAAVRKRALKLGLHRI